MLVKKDTLFRRWLIEAWFQHKDEILDYTGKECDYDAAVYFKKYRWWLKTIYKDKYGIK